MDINDRINEIMRHENMSVAAFARRLGLGDQTVRSVCIQKRNKPGYEFILSLIQTFEWIDPYWLLTGEGSMKASRSSEPANDGRAFSLKELVDYMREKDRIIEELISERTELRMLVNLQKKQQKQMERRQQSER